jgi:hypothetical protein
MSSPTSDMTTQVSPSSSICAIARPAYPTGPFNRLSRAVRDVAWDGASTRAYRSRSESWIQSVTLACSPSRTDRDAAHRR